MMQGWKRVLGALMGIALVAILVWMATALLPVARGLSDATTTAKATQPLPAATVTRRATAVNTPVVTKAPLQVTTVVVTATAPASAVTAWPPFAPRPADAMPALAWPAVPIAPDNAAQVTALTRWGRGMVWAFAWSADGTRLATGGARGWSAYDVRTGQLVGTAETHAIAYSMAFSPDGRQVAAILDDGTVRVWDVTGGEPIQELMVGTYNWGGSVAFSPDGMRLVANGYGQLIAWDLASGSYLWSVPSAIQALGGEVAFSPDGTQVAVITKKAELQVLDAATGELACNLAVPENVIGVIYTRDGSGLATTLAPGGVALYDAHQCGVRYWAFRGAKLPALGPAALSADGRSLVMVTKETAIVVDLATGAPVFESNWGPGHSKMPALSQDGTLMARCAIDGWIDIAEVANGEWVPLVSGHVNRVSDLAFKPQSTDLALATYGGVPSVWDVTTGERKQAFMLENALNEKVAFSPDGATFAAGSENGAVLWDLASGQELKTFDLQRVWALRFSPDGRLLVGTSQYGVELWDLSSGDVRSLGGGMVSDAVFAPDGKTLIIPSLEAIADLWDVTAENAMPEPLAGEGSAASTYMPVDAVAITPDGRTLAVGFADGKIQLWDFANRDLLGTLSGHAGDIAALAFVPSGRVLASGSGDSTVRLWDVSTLRELTVLEGHTFSPGYGVESLAFSSDGAVLASGGSDGVVNLWGVK